MNDEESGGVQGLRAWALAATKRALRLSPHMGPTAAARGAYDSSVAELAQLTHLLDHDPELRSTVSMQLGCVLAMRFLTEGSSPEDRTPENRSPEEDREQAQRLLRDARDPRTPIGAATDVDDRRWAALFLLNLMMPWAGTATGGAPDVSTFLDWHAKLGATGTASAVHEMRELLADVRELPLPPELQAQVRQLTALFDALAGSATPDSVRRFADLLGDGFPSMDRIRMMADIAAGLSTTPPEPSVRPDPSGADHGADHGEAPTTPPASDHGEALGIAMSAAVSSVLDAFTALQSGDPEVLNQALGRLRAASERMPPGHELDPLIKMLAATLMQTQAVGGNLQDQSLGRTHMRTLAERFGLFAGDSTDPVDREFAVLLRVAPLSAELREAHEAEDVEAVRALHAELVAIEAGIPQDDTCHFIALAVLGQACITLGMLTHDNDMMVRGGAYVEQIMATADSLPPAFREWMAQAVTLPDTLRAAATGDPTLLQGHAPAPPDAPRGQRWASTMSLGVRYGLTHDPADLDPLIAELERIRDDLRRGEEPWFAADAMWRLAEAYRARWHHTEDATAQATATDTALAALHVLAGDVILQQGPEHGLLTARSGAERGVRAAIWAAGQGRVDDAVAALEVGRAMVLHAASASRTVPELLEARGHQELAEAWRAVGAGHAPTADGPPGELPSTLRRRALEALGHRRQGNLFATPTVSDLADGVAESGADALVYLLPGDGDAVGVGLIIGPDIGVGVGGLPLLSGTGSGPLEHYLDAAAERSRRLGEPAAERAWEEALSALCDWAYQAALDEIVPVIVQRLNAGDNPRRNPTAPPRIVLVPCGRLGVVPWHAARLPEAAPHDYACQAMVISYSASGSQFLRTVRRARRDPAADPILVADPRLDLVHAEGEVTALYEAFYPRARLYGEFYEPPTEPAATGTPDELLALVGETPSLLHVASHGSAGVSPTVSALHLAFPDGTDGLPAEEGGPGAVPDRGMLTVARLLDQRGGGQQDADGGPLVVLSACETDLSTRDHDEALTLTTAFVSGGARNVVGSRWTTQDGASALMMAVFHHFLAVEGHSPADALRITQMWMLDPDRQNPGSLSGELLREMHRPGLERLPVWATFIHQGHPGPG
ncbi:CHAT domain-containing protein [Streptomyces sp. NPDC000410]|uniref:CHAT domain-containing protein n=1 Tax=Streptomyces sp. NPDC000410 TaxID=3154254 RepID=UPI00331CCBBE